MAITSRPAVVFCYIHGLDRRRINDTDTPFLHSLLARDDHVTIETIPSNELVSTVFTGVWPHEHGLWQVELKQNERTGWIDRAIDALPDWLTTTAQLVRYQFDRTFEMPAVPPRRRRRLNFHRFKYYSWATGGDRIRNIRGYPTLFDRLGESCRFRFASDLTSTRDALTDAPSVEHGVDFIQTYGLDQLQHWGLDQPQLIKDGMRQLDTWLADAAKRCADSDANMLIFSDHGQEPVHGYIDIKAMLRQWGLGDDDCTYMIEAQCARFWFHNDSARRLAFDRLPEVDHTRLITNTDLEKYHLQFTDTRYGEVYLYTDHGYTFFPHDFYHPLANLVMGWQHREVMAPRLHNPRHRGYHGHLPDHPAEQGFMVMTKPGWRPTRERGHLTDVAPTLLSLVGVGSAPTMKGRALFTPASNHG